MNHYNLQLTGTLYQLCQKGSTFSSSQMVKEPQIKEIYDEGKIKIVGEEMNQVVRQMQLLRKKLQKEEQLTFILKRYFHKIQKLMYHEETTIFNEPLNYQHLELHFRELMRRLQDIHNQRLIAPPKIYKKSNVKVYKVINTAKEQQ